MRRDNASMFWLAVMAVAVAAIFGGIRTLFLTAGKEHPSDTWLLVGWLALGLGVLFAIVAGVGLIYVWLENKGLDFKLRLPFRWPISIATASPSDSSREVETPALRDKLASSHLRDIDVHLPDLARDDWTIKGRTFERCRIYGPAVVFADKCTFYSPGFEGDLDSLLISTTNHRMLGVIGVEECVFRDCTFKRISFIGPPDSIKRFRRTFEEGGLEIRG